MNSYIILLGALAWPSSRCEPPVNTYLPPSGSGPSNGGSTSHNGSPGRNSAGAARGSQSSGGLGNPQDSYAKGQNGASIDTQYGPPTARNNGHSSEGFGSPSSQGGFNQDRRNTPSSQYGVPGQSNGSRGTSGSSKLVSGIGSSNDRGSFGAGLGQVPQTSYDPPPTGFSDNGLPSQRLTSQGGLDSSYSSPSSFGSGSRQPGGSPSSTYGAPGFGTNSNHESLENFGASQVDDFGNSANNGFEGRGSSSNQNYEESESNEPAKYEFSYDVDDSQTGTKFGHSEQRDGDLATGEYNVVLPDGRKQVVEYEAGTQGYKPQIRYEGGANSGFGSGFGRGGLEGQGGSQGYTQGGPESDLSGLRPDQGLHSERYQDAEDFGNGDSRSLGFMGYPSGRPGGQNGASSRNAGKGQRDSQTPLGPSSENGYTSGGPQGRSIGGYPSTASGSNGAGSGNNGNDEGYPRGGPGDQGSQGRPGGSGFPVNQNKGRGRPGSQNGSNEGYPSGGPSGPRGSGY